MVICGGSLTSRESELCMYCVSRSSGHFLEVSPELRFPWNELQRGMLGRGWGSSCRERATPPSKRTSSISAIASFVKRWTTGNSISKVEYEQSGENRMQIFDQVIAGFCRTTSLLSSSSISQSNNWLFQGSLAQKMIMSSFRHLIGIDVAV
ncbi:unnamed protein product [Ectocarpus sp. 4 AP-2014]